jgi:peptidylprolyl isomerase
VKTIPRYKFPEEMKPEIGVQYQMRRSEGETLVYVVTDVSESDVTMDSNHPLAGKDLTFEIRLLEIV